MIYRRLSEHLDRLESALTTCGLCQEIPPAAEALQSLQPFCVDTLSFSQWLQFVFVVRMRTIVDNELALPGACAITPMAEESLRHLDCDTRELLATLADIDQLLGRV